MAKFNFAGTEIRMEAFISIGLFHSVINMYYLFAERTEDVIFERVYLSVRGPTVRPIVSPSVRTFVWSISQLPLEILITILDGR
jgi:hypothetical protein